MNHCIHCQSPTKGFKGQKVSLGYIEAELIDIADLRAYDWKVKLSYDAKKNPRNAIRFHGSVWEIRETVIEKYY